MQFVFTELSASPVLASGNIWRSRLRPIPEGTNTAIVVRQGDDYRNDQTTLGKYQRLLNVSIEVYSRGDVPDSLADGLVESVVTRMMNDRSMGGLCDDVKLGNKTLQWESRDTDLAVIDITFEVEYETADEVL